MITVLSFTKSFLHKFVICGAIALIGFGTYNLSVATFAQQESQTVESPRNWNELMFVLIDHLVGQVGPIVGGAVTLGISFARKHGLKISAEAEEYFVKSTKSFVENQTRFLYKKIKENPQYAEAFSKGIIPPDLGKAALNNVVGQLEVELRSDEFTKTAREMLKTNIVPLAERMITQHKSEMAEKIQKMLTELTPIAVNAALLPFKTAEEAHKEKDKIIDEVLNSITATFDAENMLFSDDVAKMYIKAELNKRIGSIV